MVWVADATRIWCCCGCGKGLAAAAPISPLAWEVPYAEGAALKKQTKKFLKINKVNHFHTTCPRAASVAVHLTQDLSVLGRSSRQTLLGLAPTPHLTSCAAQGNFIHPPRLLCNRQWQELEMASVGCLMQARPVLGLSDSKSASPVTSMASL